MNISAVNTFNPVKQNFRFKKAPSFTSNPVQEDNKSKQNNDPDIIINPAIKLSADIDSMISAMEESGIIDDEDLEDLDNDVDEENIPQYQAQNIVDTLKLAVQLFSKNVPLNAKITPFVQTNADMFISKIENMDKALNDLAKGLQTASIEADEEIIEDIEFIAQKAQELAQTNYSEIAKILKTKYYKEIKELFKKHDRADNYAYMQALEAGFERNPRRVFDILTYDEFVSTVPKIKDNNDGTSTYTYDLLATIAKVKRKNSNGDFISLSVGMENDTSCIFNEDGSIKELRVQDAYDHSETTFIPDNKKKTVQVVWVTNNSAYVREYKRSDEGIYLLKKMQMYSKK